MDKFGFWAVFALVFLAEVPCILRTTAIQLQNNGIWNVVWGTLAGNAGALLVGILAAKAVQIYVPERFGTYVNYGAGLAFIALGLYIILEK